jgi:TatD DNase family protein
MLRGERSRAILARMPTDRVLTESDGPFAKLDGSPVLPWQVDRGVSELRGVWSLPRERVDQIILDNLRGFLLILICQPASSCREIAEPIPG